MAEEKKKGNDDLIARAKKVNDEHHLRVLARVVQKGLKPEWKESSLIGFLDVMASLHKQTKDWKFPSDSLFNSLRPKEITTLVLALEERRKQ